MSTKTVLLVYLPHNAYAIKDSFGTLTTNSAGWTAQDSTTSQGKLELLLMSVTALTQHRGMLVLPYVFWTAIQLLTTIHLGLPMLRLAPAILASCGTLTCSFAHWTVLALVTTIKTAILVFLILNVLVILDSCGMLMRTYAGKIVPQSKIRPKIQVCPLQNVIVLMDSYGTQILACAAKIAVLDNKPLGKSNLKRGLMPIPAIALMVMTGILTNPSAFSTVPKLRTLIKKQPTLMENALAQVPWFGMLIQPCVFMTVEKTKMLLKEYRQPSAPVKSVLSGTAMNCFAAETALESKTGMETSGQMPLPATAWGV